MSETATITRHRGAKAGISGTVGVSTLRYYTNLSDHAARTGAKAGDITPDHTDFRPAA